MQKYFPDKNQILEAHQRINKFINKTPILTSNYINSLLTVSTNTSQKAQIYFKCQNLQKTGSFKVRGAANKISQLTSPPILCAHSSGNHAQAVAYVCQILKIPVRIIMPNDTPLVKKQAVRCYGAKIHESGPTMKDQQNLVKQISQKYNAPLIHPYNDFKVIAGAATVSLEIYQDIQNVDYVVVPIGGGGLTSGTLLATKYFSPKTKVIGVQPYLARDAYLSIKKGDIVPQFPPKTLGQGVRTGIGEKTFEVMKSLIKDIILVTEEQMIEATRMFMERMKIVVEFSGAIVLAAILKDKRFIGKKVCAIISGGNIDLGLFFSQKLKQVQKISKL